MASSASSSSRKKRSNELSAATAWSEWKWDDRHGCWNRYRLDNIGNRESEYREQPLHESIENPSSRAVPRYALEETNSFGTPDQIISSYSTSSSYALENFDQNFASLNLDMEKERNTVYQNSTSTTYGVSNFPAISSTWRGGTNASYLSRTPQASTPTQSSIAVQQHDGQGDYAVSAAQKEHNLLIGSSAEDVEYLDPNFRVHHSSQFKFGKVFKILWAEPTGNNGTQITENVDSYSTKLGQEFAHKIRRFVVVKSFEGHCLALPILTYGKRATTKPGSQGWDHAIIYTKDPVLYEGEDIRRKPIRVIPRTPRDKLAPQSRLNYAKVYTIEYNVKVLFIGEVHKDYLHQLRADYNNTQGYCLDEPGSPIEGSSKGPSAF